MTLATLMLAGAIGFLFISLVAGATLLYQSITGAFSTPEDRRTLFLLFWGGIIGAGIVAYLATLVSGH